MTQRPALSTARRRRAGRAEVDAGASTGAKRARLGGSPSGVVGAEGGMDLGDSNVKELSGMLGAGRGGKKLVIRPFKRAPKLPENYFAEVWEAYLLPCVRAVHGDRPVPHSLELLYRKVDDLCMHKHAPELFELLRDVCARHVTAEVGTLAAGSSEPDAWLRTLDVTWRRHCTHMMRISAVFLKLDRSYMARLSGKAMRSLWDMGVSQFCERLRETDAVLPRTTTSLLSCVERDRCGEVVDTQRVRRILRMLAAMGLYKDFFEKQFLSLSVSFYRSESEAQVCELDVPSYLEHVERRLKLEADRSSSVLDEGTAMPLMEIVEQRLISNHVVTILKKGFTAMCDEQRLDDLRRLYLLLGRANASATGDTYTASPHELLRQSMVAYVKKVGLLIVEDPTKDSDMVPSLLALKLRADNLVVSAFESSGMLSSAVNYAFEAFVNTRENKPAELIAKHLDGVLRMGNKAYSEEELESTLDRVLILFRFIDGKDVFEAFYKKDLAKRLLHDKSASHDLEKVMISKLKAECGSQFTSKLEAMFRDVDSSKDMMTSFKANNRLSTPETVSADMELNVYVLEASRWPLSAQKVEVKLPLEILVYQDGYKMFYLENHGRRSLTWQHADCSCIVNAHFPKGSKILSLSLYQTLVVMLFNETDALGYPDLAERTGLEEKELHRTLLSLACGRVRVLQKEPRGRTVNRGDSFSFNADFTHRLTRIKVNAIQMKETVEENADTTTKVFQERSYQIDATLVRIMKTRRTLPHSALIAEVYSQLKFPHKPADIKKRIESLIEREYLERSPDDPQVYNYLA